MQLDAEIATAAAPPAKASQASAPKLSDAEPVAVASSITTSIKTVVLAVISLALAFGWVSWSDQESAAVLAVVAAGFALLSAVSTVLVRQKVTPLAAPRAADGAPLVKAP
jgi:hypothetical protein